MLAHRNMRARTAPQLRTSLLYITDSQVAQLSTTSAAGLRAKAVADRVRDGTASSDIKNVNNKNGSYALTTALWYGRTRDVSYLAPLQAYILASPKPPSAVQALNEWRASFGLFTAVQLLRRWGVWNDNALLPNHGNITWRDFLLTYGGTRYDMRQVDTGVVNSRWNIMAQTSGLWTSSNPAAKSASNWGAVARAGNLALLALLQDMGIDVADDLAKLEAIFRQWLGDTTTGLPNFYSTIDYRSSWDNWSTVPFVGSRQIVAGVGNVDAANPGLDGVIINDIDRGGTDYAATDSQFGAVGSGLTYPFENAEYAWNEAAMYLNSGKPARTWGGGGDALRRMNDRFARISPDGTSQFQAAAAIAGIYGTMRTGGARIAGLADTAYGTNSPTNATENMLFRSGPYFDWLVEGTTWAQ